MNRILMKWIFAGIILVLFLEMGLSLTFTEPFPAIMYPSFSDIPSINSPIKKPRIIVFFHNQDSVEITKEDFFLNMPNVYNNVILNENFNEKNSFLALQKEVRTFSLKIGSKKLTFDLKEVSREEDIKDGIAWIANSVQQTLHRKDLDRVEVQVYNYQLSHNKETPMVQGKLAEKFVVNLRNHITP